MLTNMVMSTVAKGITKPISIEKPTIKNISNIEQITLFSQNENSFNNAIKKNANA